MAVARHNRNGEAYTLADLILAMTNDGSTVTIVDTNGRSYELEGRLNFVDLDDGWLSWQVDCDNRDVRLCVAQIVSITEAW